MIIKIERYYNYPDLIRQTPRKSFQWNDFLFTEEPVNECDYLIILDYPKHDFTIRVNPKNIIHLALEPPNEMSKYRQFGNTQIGLSFNQLNDGSMGTRSHGALPWHIDKDYDFLCDLKPEHLQKENRIAWITSNQSGTKGHQKRMEFLERIRELPFVDLYGRGINPIADKWDALSIAKYAIAYENYQSKYYWTEKIMDCFLSYTMPLYYGCDNISGFFPKNSYLQLDPKDKHIALFLKEIVSSSRWDENVEAIRSARELVLQQYQLFPFLYSQISALETRNGSSKFLPKQDISFKGGDAFFDNYPLHVYINKKIIFKIRKKIDFLFR